MFYELSDNSANEQQWTFAVHAHPTSTVVKWSCPECGRAAQYPAGAFDVTVEGGSAFPDVLGCGFYPLLVISDRMVCGLRDSGITCFQEYPVRVVEVLDSPLRSADAPSYSHIELTGECMINFTDSGAVIRSVCANCGEIKVAPPVIKRFAFVDGSWNGCDLFRDHRYFARVSFCTKKIVELANASRWTNCRFQQMS